MPAHGSCQFLSKRADARFRLMYRLERPNGETHNNKKPKTNHKTKQQPRYLLHIAPARVHTIPPAAPVLPLSTPFLPVYVPSFPLSHSPSSFAIPLLFTLNVHQCLLFKQHHKTHEAGCFVLDLRLPIPFDGKGSCQNPVEPWDTEMRLPSRLQPSVSSHVCLNPLLREQEFFAVCKHKKKKRKTELCECVLPRRQ